MHMNDDNETLQKIWDIIKHIKIALMITHDADGRLHARPMETQRPDDAMPFTGEIWFMTSRTSGKIAEIMHDPYVLLSYAEPQNQNYVSVAGHAELVFDKYRVRELWHEAFRAWFPGGPDDPDIALIRVQVQAAEYWDSPTKSVIYAYGYFKARLTGQPVHVGEHQRITL